MILDDTPRQHEKLGKLVGRSPAMQQVFEQLKKAAHLDIPILLQGETGTGKDLAAQSIHLMSDHSNGPYIPINLGALPPEIIASELFGHEKGAFTGAVVQHKGKLEQGRNGTVFLDEIESIDEKMQVTLLRLIESKRFYRLGGKRKIATNVRLTAASNENLQQLVDQGTFRKDLFYRLDVFPIHLPPLRQRKEDIPLLISRFVAEYNRMFKKQITRIEDACLRSLEEYEWPGNVRDLKNAIQRAVVWCEGEELLFDHFPGRFQTAHSSLPILTFEIGTPLEDVERQMIRETLDFVNNNRTEAAKLLGISRRALYNRLSKHQIT